MSGHTPGPWKIVENCDSNGYGDADNVPFCIESQKWFVATIMGDVEDIDPRANARLIAAAPELLEAAEWAIPLLGAMFETPEIQLAMANLNMTAEPNLSNAKAAIAKATGKD